MAGDELFLGIDLGGTKIATAVVDGNAEVLGSARKVTPDSRPVPVDAALDAMVDATSEALKAAGVNLGQIGGIGVGAAGSTDVRSGTVVSASNLGWRNIPLANLLAERLNWAGPLVVDKDTNAAAIGEHLAGAGRGRAHMFYVAVGTGIGGGIILDGRLYRGATGGAGDFGHVVVEPDGPPCGCGRWGCLEAITSGTAIAAQAEQALAAGKGSTLTALRGSITAADVAKAAQGGDAVALDIFQRAAYYLGLALATYVNLVNPECIIIGGGVAESGNLLFQPVRTTVRERALPTLADIEIVPAELGQQAGIVGAALLVRALEMSDR